jgi:hypothetical protein
MIHENVVKNKFWGNSWYISSGFNISWNHELDFNLGRTYGRSSCGGAGCMTTTTSWGLGYGFTTIPYKNFHTIKAFWEGCFFWFPPFSAGVRGEYFYDLTHRAHYFKPAAGLSLLYFDVFYNYSFNVSGTINLYRHGITLRIKLFYPMKKWENHYPNRC